MQSEYRILHERESAVKERENNVQEQKIRLEATIIEEVNRRVAIKLQVGLLFSQPRKLDKLVWE